LHQLPSRLPAPQRLLRGLALILPLLLAPLAHADGTFSDLAELGAHGARVSAMALDLDSGKVLGSLNPGERLTPASMTKMVTAATALHHWAADHDFPTRLLTQGNIDGNTLKGDLILQGGGDATLDDQALWSLVAQLRSTGITRVTGKLVVNPYPFGTVPCQTQDRCEAMTRSDTAYDAPLSSIGVDFGTWCIQVRPTQPGAPAQVRGCAVAKLPIPVDGTIQTVGARKKQTFWIERVTDQDGDELHVNGNIPYGRTVKVYRSMSDPARGAGLLLQEMLNEAGINVNGAVVIGKGGLPSPATTLASIATLSLREQLGRMLRYSNNYIADVLTLDLGTGGKDPPAATCRKPPNICPVSSPAPTTAWVARIRHRRRSPAAAA
jgi:D-alanyl-D-alanine carboxypeptidase (penicillin-binding protein 4)